MATNTVGNCTRGCFPLCICTSLRGISPPPKSPTPWPISFMLSEVPSCRYVTRTPGFNLPYCSVQAVYSGLGTLDPDPTSEIASWALIGKTPIPTHITTCRKTHALLANGAIRYLDSQL